jgi:hypothetical protein
VPTRADPRDAGVRFEIGSAFGTANDNPTRWHNRGISLNSSDTIISINWSALSLLRDASSRAPAAGRKRYGGVSSVTTQLR